MHEQKQQQPHPSQLDQTSNEAAGIVLLEAAQAILIRRGT